jgi:hypothetical protein
MKIELKNVKHMESLSEETNCYSASLYVDGKKIGDVSNQGQGGPDMFHGDREAYEKADAWIKANKPPYESSFGGDPLEMDMELYCGELLTNWLITKDLKTALRSRVLIIKPDEKGVFEFKFKKVRKVESKHIQIVKASHPKATILNDLPFEEALTHYINNTA